MVAIRRFRQLAIEHAFFNAPDGAAKRFNFVEVFKDFRFDAVGQRLDGVGTAKWIHRSGHSGLVGNDLLRAKGDGCCVFCRYRESLVIRGRRNRLHSAESGRKRFDCNARNIVQRLLCDQIAAKRVREDLQLHRFGILRTETFLHQLGPDAARCAELRDLFQHIDAG